jgi:hypothetical protein
VFGDNGKSLALRLQRAPDFLKVNTSARISAPWLHATVRVFYQPNSGELDVTTSSDGICFGFDLRRGATKR